MKPEAAALAKQANVALDGGTRTQDANLYKEDDAMALDATELAQFQFGVATEYLKAAIKLHESDNAPWRPKYFLICHSIEIYIKSVLIFRGYNEKALKKLGHNISLCFSEAFEKNNQAEVGILQRQIISQLSLYHLDASFRYFRLENKQLFSFDETLHIVSVISNVIYNEIVPSDF